MGPSLFVLMACAVVLAYGQSVTIVPEVIQGREGDNVTITCNVGPVEPSSTRLLTENNQLLDTNTQDVQSDRVVYTYGPLVRESDNGRMVICSFGGVTATANISVLFPPMYSVDPAQRDVVEGTGDYTVMLSVTGNPPPTIQETVWTFSGLTGSQIPNGVNLEPDSLSFDSINRQHSGVYSVSSTTTAGDSNTLNITINVLYPPMFVGELFESIACVPVIPDDSSQYSCAMRPGDSGTLDCAAVGNPSPSLTIMETSSVISANNSSGLVSVGPVTVEDNGATVQCTATNSQDTEQRSFIIYVGSEPAEPSTVTANVEGNMIVISWLWSDPDNNVPLSRFLITVTKESTSTPVISESIAGTERTFSFALSQLEGNTLYNIAVQSDNLLQSSSPVGAQVTTPTVIDGTGSAGTITSCLLSVLLMTIVTMFL